MFIIRIIKRLNKAQEMARGFTLIEVLVVITVIGLLASAVLVVFPINTGKTRDAQRLQDMHQIVTALRIYQVSNGVYPFADDDSCCKDWDQAPCRGDKTFISTLVTSGTANIIPSDPKPKGGEGNNCYGYGYYYFPAGSYGCDTARGGFFVLGVRDMETVKDVHPESPGFSCPSRNFQDDFEWVTGGFEK